MANIRDQCSWVHSGRPQQATEKAKDLVRMAVSRASKLMPLAQELVPVANAALVVGGGVAGQTCALAFAEQGFPVHLVEKSDSLGGTARSIHRTLDRDDVQAFLTGTIARVTGHKLITVHLNSTVSKVDGHVGGFKSKIAANGQVAEVKHGVVVVATGATERKPESYGYGSHTAAESHRGHDPVRRAAERRTAVLQPRLLHDGGQERFAAQGPPPGRPDHGALP
jgi:heterodisulfide reductase subunit A